MTSRQRIVLLALAAVVLVGGIALASLSGGDDDSSSSSETTAQATTPGETAGDGETAKTTKERPKEEVRMENVRIRDGKPVGGAKTFKYERGETIRLSFTADSAGEVHIHGYEDEFELTPDQAHVVRFKADLEGIFEIEEHDSGELLAKLQVSPK